MILDRVGRVLKWMARRGETNVRDETTLQDVNDGKSTLSIDHHTEHPEWVPISKTNVEKNTSFFDDESLKERRDSSFDQLQNVCICMTDLVGFTEWASNHTPQTIANTMIKYNSFVCHLIEPYNPDVKKVELVGDCCLIMSCGASTVLNCHNILSLSIQFLESANTIQCIFNSEKIGARIGVHLADIIGMYLSHPRKYQIFGNDINICSRLESSADPNTIHVSSKTLSHTDVTQFTSKIIQGHRTYSNEYKGVGMIQSRLWYSKQKCVLCYNFTSYLRTKLAHEIGVSHKPSTILLRHERNDESIRPSFLSIVYQSVMIHLTQYDVDMIYNKNSSISKIQYLIIICDTQTTKNKAIANGMSKTDFIFVMSENTRMNMIKLTHLIQLHVSRSF